MIDNPSNRDASGNGMSLSAPANYLPSPAFERGPGGFMPRMPDDEDVVPWARYLDALKRHAWFIIAVTILGSAIGMYVARRVKPVYTAQAKIWIGASANSQGERGGPIGSQQLLRQS